MEGFVMALRSFGAERVKDGLNERVCWFINGPKAH